MNTSSPNKLWRNRLENGSLSSINIEYDMDRSQSCISQGSNDKCFSIKDIFPDESFSKPESKHQRVSSQQVDILSPQVLFSHIRKNSRQLSHERKPSYLIIEVEELNSTRMQTCQSRRISDSELGIVPVSVNIEEKIEIDDPKEENFCKNCLREVEVVEKFNDESKVESILLEFVSYFFVCWAPQWLNNMKVKCCNNCGYAI